MEVQICRSCNKMYQHVAGERLCLACREKYDQDYRKVRDYIWNNKDCKILEVAEACDVNPQTIKRWVREEKIEFSSPEFSGIYCERCNKPISSGKYCEKCLTDINKTFVDAFGLKVRTQTEPDANRLRKDSSAKMRYGGLRQ